MTPTPAGVTAPRVARISEPPTPFWRWCFACAALQPFARDAQGHWRCCCGASPRSGVRTALEAAERAGRGA
jgi:hypothetical protein